MGISLKLGSLKIKNTTFLLLSIKLFYCFFGVYIFGKLSPLGDSDAYLNSPIILNSSLLINNTILISTFAALLKSLLFLDIFVHLTFCLLAFWALKLVLETLQFSRTKTCILVFLLSLPSFGMWTSVVSKETLTCVFTCYNIIWIINLLRHEKMRFPLWLNIIFLYFTLIMRPTVGLGIVLLIFALYFNRIYFINKYIRFFILISGVTSTAVVVYIFTARYVEDRFFPLIEAYFDPRYYISTSTRDFGFWETASDLYVKSPLGILVANLGPTFVESLTKPFFLPYFFEGLFFIFTCFYLIFLTLFTQTMKKIINSNYIFFLIFGFFVILFLNYPFGIYNPGSALRYRSNYYHFFIILLFFFYQNEKITPSKIK